MAWSHDQAIRTSGQRAGGSGKQEGLWAQAVFLL